MNHKLPNFAGFYSSWQKLPPGPRAEIRRTAEPENLLDLSAFYRLVEPFGWKAALQPWEKERWQRLVFLINHVTDRGENSLGEALALSDGINEKRLFQIVRANSPNDIIQLRRLLKQAEPEVNWLKMAKQLWYWNLRQKRNLLEDFVLTPQD